MRGWVGIGLAIASLGADGAAISVERRGCAPTVHLRVRDASLSEVLQRLGESQGFEVRFEASSDPKVEIDFSAPLADVVAKLTRFQNVIVAQNSDSRCPRQLRITRIWVLPQGNEASRTVESGARAMPAATPLDPQAKKLQEEGIRMYERAHGITPSESDPH